MSIQPNAAKMIFRVFESSARGIEIDRGSIGILYTMAGEAPPSSVTEDLEGIEILPFPEAKRLAGKIMPSRSLH